MLKWFNREKTTPTDHSVIRLFGYSVISPDHSVIRLFGYSVIRATRKGFTLIELLVVVAMIAIIMGAMTTSVTASRRRAKIAKATAEVKELTNAFLAYENYARGGSFKLEEKEREEATADSISFLLGRAKADNGNDIPVLYNGAVAANKKILDPWGHPYRFTIRAKTVTPPGNHTLETGYYMPNIYRLTEGER